MPTKSSISKAVVIVASAAMLSKVLGLLRDIVIAGKFGTSVETDAFIIALAAPEFLREILAGGALTAAFIPVFSSYLAKHEYEDASRVFSTIFNILLISLTAIVVIGILNSRKILGLIAPGFSPQALTLSVKLSYMLFPAMLFMGLASFLGGALNAAKHFLLPSLKQTVLNLSVIISALLLTAIFGIKSLAIGFIIGGFFQFVMLIQPIIKRKFKYIFGVSLTHPGIKQIGLLWIPVIIALVLSNANSLIVKMFASTLSAGSIASLHFAYRLKQLPVVIFGVTLATAIFPFISWQVVQENMNEFKRSIERALKVVFFVTFPLCLGLALFRIPIIRILFERGSFSEESTYNTAIALICYLPGAVAVSLNYILIRVYYALKNTVTPLKATALALVVMVISGLILKDIYSHGGLAFANSLADITIFIVLFLYFIGKSKILDIYSIGASFVKIILISLIAIVPARFIFSLMEKILNFNLLKFQILSLIIAIIFSITIMITAVWVFNIEEGKYFIKVLKKNILKS